MLKLRVKCRRWERAWIDPGWHITYYFYLQRPLEMWLDDVITLFDCTEPKLYNLLLKVVCSSKWQYAWPLIGSTKSKNNNTWDASCVNHRNLFASRFLLWCLRKNKLTFYPFLHEKPANDSWLVWWTVIEMRITFRKTSFTVLILIIIVYTWNTCSTS